MKKMNWKQLWTSYPPAESPRRLDFFRWMSCLEALYKASSGGSLPSNCFPTKARKITSTHGNPRELQKKTKIMMIMMSFFSGTPFFLWKKTRETPNFCVLLFHPRISGGSFFDHPTVAAHEPTELTQIIDRNLRKFHIPIISQVSKLTARGWGWGNPPELGYFKILVWNFGKMGGVTSIGVIFSCRMELTESFTNPRHNEWISPLEWENNSTSIQIEAGWKSLKISNQSFFQPHLRLVDSARELSPVFPMCWLDNPPVSYEEIHEESWISTPALCWFVGRIHDFLFQIKTAWSKIPDLLDSVDWRSLQIQGTKSASDRQVES